MTHFIRCGLCMSNNFCLPTHFLCWSSSQSLCNCANFIVQKRQIITSGTVIHFSRLDLNLHLNSVCISSRTNNDWMCLSPLATQSSWIIDLKFLRIYCCKIFSVSFTTHGYKFQKPKLQSIRSSLIVPVPNSKPFGKLRNGTRTATEYNIGKIL